ncbi:MAG: hypothetical protein KGI33_06890 [Thaumarchaeota archaeon]|nr:hypothetical protein [Nitrososphaerota archaeon]
MADFAKFNRLLALDEDINSVTLLDRAGNPLINNTRAAFPGQSDLEEDNFKTDLHILKRILDLANDSHGETISLAIRRKNMQQAVYYLKDYILYVTYKHRTRDADMKILEKIEAAIIGSVIEA